MRASPAVRALPLLLAACAADPVPGGFDPLPGDRLPPGPGVPSAPVVELRPLSPTTAQNIVLKLVQPSVDPDGDPLQYINQWRVNNVVVAYSGRRVLPAAYFRRGDQVVVFVEANDGIHASPRAVSDTVTVRNSPPVVATATIQATAPQAGAPIVASVTCTDADGDVADTLYTWRVDGGVVASGPSADTLPAGITQAGDRVAVVVRCDDGTDVGASARVGPVVVQP